MHPNPTWADPAKWREAERLADAELQRRGYPVLGHVLGMGANGRVYALTDELVAKVTIDTYEAAAMRYLADHAPTLVPKVECVVRDFAYASLYRNDEEEPLSLIVREGVVPLATAPTRFPPGIVHFLTVMDDYPDPDPEVPLHQRKVLVQLRGVDEALGVALSGADRTFLLHCREFIERHQAVIIDLTIHNMGITPEGWYVMTDVEIARPSGMVGGSRRANG